MPKDAHLQAISLRAQQQYAAMPGAHAGSIAGPGLVSSAAPAAAVAQVLLPAAQYVQPIAGGSGPAVDVGVATQLLSSQQKYWLHDRALIFIDILSQALERDVGQDLADNTDTRQVIATLAAAAMFGDDYNRVTHRDNTGWNAAGWTAARDYVEQNLVAWWDTYYAVPSAPVPSGG
jgi:hypothetical protein